MWKKKKNAQYNVGQEIISIDIQMKIGHCQGWQRQGGRNGIKLEAFLQKRVYHSKTH